MVVRILLVAVLALVVAAVIGHVMAADPGFIVIGFGGKVLRTSFAFFIVLLVALVIALYVGIRLLAQLLTLRGRLGRWSGERRRRRAYRSLADGLLARAAGDYGRAERLFSLGADDNAQPEVHYLAAAEAAQALHANGRRDNYLRLARDLKPDAAPALELQRAAWLLDQDQLDDAAALIDTLSSNQVSSPALLRLRLRLLERRQDMTGLLRLLPALRRDRVMTHDQANELERDCAVALLRSDTVTADGLMPVWDALSKPLRVAPPVVAAYVQALRRFERNDEAERVLAHQLDRVWNGDLAALYGEIECLPTVRQLRKVEQWAAKHDADPGLRLARARLAMRAQLWGPARTQLERLLAEHPLPLFYRMLAEVAEGAGDADAAQRYRKRGLEVATA